MALTVFVGFGIEVEVAEVKNSDGGWQVCKEDGCRMTYISGEVESSDDRSG
jgi:hypothetical protein